jgi:2-polyprenyl-3-methyl-5-hydroxy-6-metoxy-1,4-benzoquinol methylase
MVQEFSCLVCLDCGLKYLDPIPDTERLAGIYDSSYYSAWFEGTGESELESMKISTFSRYLNIIKSHRKNGRLLDLGCAFGALMKVASKENFEPYGVEINQVAVEEASKVSKHVFCGTVEQAGFESDTFDVVVMLDFLEHLKEPYRTMEEVRRILKANGVLLIVTPDTGSLTARLLGSYWPHYKVEHLYYFNRQNIRKLLRGFRIVESATAKKNISFSYFGSVLKKYTASRFLRIMGSLCCILSSKLINFSVSIPLGEMLILADKDNSPDRGIAR